MPFKTAYGVSDRELIRFVEENELVKFWCQRFSSRSQEGWLSGSRRNYARVLCRFFKWLKIVKDINFSPAELLNRQIQLRNSRSIADRLWLRTLVFEHSRDNPDFADYADLTKYNIYITVKSFCDYHCVPLTSAHNAYGKKRRRRKHHRKQIRLVEAKKVLGGLSQRDRSILLIMLQSGMDIGTVLNKFGYMWHSQVKPQLDTDRQRIKVELDERKRNNSPYFTYISSDGIHELRKWLNERRRIIERHLAEGKSLDKTVIEGEPIFITRYGKPLRSDQFIKQFNRMMHGKVTSHMFRKLFKTEASVPERGVYREVIEFFMGHTPGQDEVGGIYDRNVEIRPEIYEKEYAKLEPYINIYSSPQAVWHTNPLFHDIELLTQILGGREFFKELVKDVKAKLAKQLAVEKLE